MAGGDGRVANNRKAGRKGIKCRDTEEVRGNNYEISCSIKSLFCSSGSCHKTNSLMLFVVLSMRC